MVGVRDSMLTLARRGGGETGSPSCDPRARCGSGDRSLDEPPLRSEACPRWRAHNPLSRRHPERGGSPSAPPGARSRGRPYICWRPWWAWRAGIRRRSRVGRGKESTDDAQIDADVVAVSTRVAGTVLKVHATDNQPVKKGDHLIESTRPISLRARSRPRPSWRPRRRRPRRPTLRCPSSRRPPAEASRSPARSSRAPPARCRAPTRK